MGGGRMLLPLPGVRRAGGEGWRVAGFTGNHGNIGQVLGYWAFCLGGVGGGGGRRPREISCGFACLASHLTNWPWEYKQTENKGSCQVGFIGLGGICHYIASI